MRRYIYLAFIIVFLSQNVFATDYGDHSLRAHSILTGKKVQVTVFNFGQTGREDAVSFDEQMPFEWPTGSRHIYLASSGLMIGAEVSDTSGAIKHVVDVMNYRNNPDNGDSWSFEPLPGYSNPALYKPAISNKPWTWPDFWADKKNDPSDPGWSGHWPGFLGKDVFLPGPEIYYRMSDDNYNKFLYFPDSADSTRRGLGLEVAMHLFSIDKPVFADMLFQGFTVYNRGDKKLSKVNLTMWISSNLGGDGDSMDDIFDYNLDENMLYLHDIDHIAPNFGDKTVGSVGISFLQTPKDSTGMEQGLTGVSYLNTGSLNLNDDEAVWSHLMQRNQFADPNDFYIRVENYISSGYFDIAAGDSVQCMLVYLFANGPKYDPDNHVRRNRLDQKYTLAKLAFERHFNFTGFETTFSDPQPDDTLSASTIIDWDFEPNPGTTQTYLYLSTNNGDDYNVLSNGLATRSYFWQTLQSDDGILNRLMAISFSDSAISVTESGRFILNNSTQTAPQILFTNLEDGDTLSGLYPLKWIAGDADGDAYKVALFYKSVFGDDVWKVLLSPADTIQSFLLDTPSFANSGDIGLKAQITTDDQSAEQIIKNISLLNPRHVLSDSSYQRAFGSPASGTFELHVVDSSQLTQDTYLLTFTGSKADSLKYSVQNRQSHLRVLQDIPLLFDAQESPLFEGMRLLIINKRRALIDSLSGWSDTDIYPFAFNQFYDGFTFGYENRADYKISFGERGIGQSTSYLIAGMTRQAQPVNYVVENLTTHQKIQTAFLDQDTLNGGQGIFSWGYIEPFFYVKSDIIVFLEKINGDTLQPTYQLYFDGSESDQGTRFPGMGDSLILIQSKPFYSGDSIYFSLGNLVTTIQTKPRTATNFALYPAYPNPFNAALTIRFSLPHSSRVNLTVYNILGQKVVDLINTLRPAGNQRILWQAGAFASGIYFIHIQAGEFAATRKVILIK